MLNNEKLLNYSLVNGLVYLMTLRGFCININCSFLENNQPYKEAAKNFYQKFTELTNGFLKYADGNLSKKFLESGSLITEYTMPTVELTEKLFSTTIALDTLQATQNIKPGIPTNISDETIEQIQMFNKVALVITLNFIDFLKDIFNKEINNQIFSYSYPYLIRKMIEEAQLYVQVLERLIRKLDTDPSFAIDFEFKSVSLLKSFGMFIRSYVDPSRNDIILKAQSFIIEIDNLLEDYKSLSLTPDNQRLLTNRAYKLVIRFADFIASIIEELLKAKVYLIVEPIFLDNMYRSTNIAKYFVFDPDLGIEIKEG